MPSSAALLSGACTIVGNVNNLQMNNAGGFSYTLKNIAVTCNNASVANPQMVGANGQTWGLDAWNIAPTTVDAAWLNRFQSMVQTAAASGMKITISYNPANMTASEKAWNMLNPGMTFISAP